MVKLTSKASSDIEHSWSLYSEKANRDSWPSIAVTKRGHDKSDAKSDED